MTDITIISSDEEFEIQTPQKHKQDIETIIIISDDEDLPNTPSVETNVSEKLGEIAEDTELGTYIDNLLEKLDTESQPVTLEIEQNKLDIQLFQDDETHNHDETIPIISKNIIKRLDKDTNEQIYTITKRKLIRNVQDSSETIQNLTITKEIETKIPKLNPEPSTSTSSSSSLDLNNKAGLTDEEYESHVALLVAMAEEAKVPEITIRRWNSLKNFEFDDKIIKDLERDKVQPLKIIQIMQSILIQSFPTTVFQYQDSEFSLVQIRGTVIAIDRNLGFGNKSGIVVDDSTAVIRIVLDNSPEEIKYRQQVKNNIEEANSFLTFNEIEMNEISNMSSEEFHKTLTFERENKFLTTLALIIGRDTDKKNEIQFPLLKDLNLGDTVTVFGRLVTNAGDRFIYGYNMKRVLYMNDWLQLCRAYDGKC